MIKDPVTVRTDANASIVVNIADVLRHSQQKSKENQGFILSKPHLDVREA